MIEPTDPMSQVAHRPWPLPKRPWVMSQRWSNLLFMHWPIATDILRALVPADLELDRHDNTAWLSVTPFQLSHLHARGLPPLPVGSAFPEVNVRTYVNIDGKPGVFFFSLDAGSILAVLGARALYHLPYFEAEMRVTERPDGGIDYTSRRSTHTGARLDVSYVATGPVRGSEPGSLDHWLTERYCLYAVDLGGRILRAEIHHEPWPLQDATVEIRENTLATAAAIRLPDIPPRVSFSRRLDVLVWMPERV
jgi:uncharacterized protein